MSVENMLNIAFNALDEKKAEDIKVIDISKISVLADYFIIASGKNKSQIQAMADNVEEKWSKVGFKTKQVEGYDSADWIILDGMDVIVHIFDEESKKFYDLDRIWRDGILINNNEI